MTRAVRANNRIFQVGSMQRSSREFRYACELVRQGRLGSISRVLTGFGSPGKSCDLPEQAREPGLDWDLWLGPAPDRPYNSVLSPRGVHDHFPNWRLYWEYGGGMVTDWGAHHVDIAQWGLGMDQSGPVEVIPPDDWETAKAGGKLIYANGVELVHTPDNGVTFIGSEGELFVNRGKFKLTLGGKVLADNTVKPADPKEKVPNAGEIAERAAKELLGDTAPMLYVSDDHKTDFLNAIKSRKDPICPVEVGAHSINACHLLNIGYRYGRKLKWDPAKEEFAGGTGDPKWLTREYRDPWRVV
jgi:predicted dehydrogenase